MDKLAVVALLGALVGLVSVKYRRGVDRDAALGGSAAGTTWPAVPAAQLAAGVPCTWLVFTTPWCASCEQVKAMVSSAFPHHGVRTIDATVDIELGETYDVRRAPTTLLADHDGNVLERLVGPEAVSEFIGAADDSALLDS